MAHYDKSIARRPSSCLVSVLILMISEATQVLHEISGGDHTQCDRLFQMVYDDFRRIAHRYVEQEDPDKKDMQATDVVHEVYIRLIDQDGVSWKDRSHFFAVGAHIMRHVLVDNARRRLAQKRGGGAARVPLDIVAGQLKISPQCDADVIAVHQAIEKLAESDEQQARIVELRFFAGLTVKETAEAMGVSLSTTERNWRVAKAWLRRELSA
ncbi:MAG: sigma-70 family RNA polymerase sigma factor [Pirellulaceae bacterium]